MTDPSPNRSVQPDTGTPAPHLPVPGAGPSPAARPGTRPPCADVAKGVTCEQCVNFLLDYLDGALPPDERFRFESHIAFCADCEIYLENYRKVAALCHGCGCVERLAQTPAPEKLIQAILQARAHGHTPS